VIYKNIKFIKTVKNIPFNNPATNIFLSYNLLKLKKYNHFSSNNKKNVEVWGDGNQTRSFLYIDDCVDAILKLFQSNFKDPINIGSEEKVSINQLIDIIENIANIKLKREYQLDKPKGVNGRSSNNDLIKKVLNWNYNYSLKDGIEKTYHWINQLYQNKNNNNFIKFTKK